MRTVTGPFLDRMLDDAARVPLSRKFILPTAARPL